MDDPFTIILLVVIGIVLFMASITAISSWLFPNLQNLLNGLVNGFKKD